MKLVAHRKILLMEFADIWETEREIERVVTYGRWSLNMRVVVQRESTVFKLTKYL